jgi:hypothetical protein
MVPKEIKDEQGKEETKAQEENEGRPVLEGAKEKMVQSD